MKNIVIIPNPNKDLGLSVTKRLTEKLISLGLRVYADTSLSELRGVVFYDSFPRDAELIVVIGGDGSVIDASPFAIENDIPIIGVNLGRVGYLTEVDPDGLDVFDKLVSGEYSTVEKMLLTVSVSDTARRLSTARLAVNDVVISQSKFLGICEFSLENKNGDGVRYRGDGIIVATPEGSTAYSLSAGGPIVSHGLDAILVTPVCPHSFFNRSIIFNSDEKLTVTNLDSKLLNICADGRLFAEIKKGESCTVSSSNRKMKMLTLTENNMFSTLFKKMRILEDVK